MIIDPIANPDIPYLTKDQMIEVDRAMVGAYDIQLIQMMENAGRSLASLARARFLGAHVAGKVVVVLAGRGGNGGGALVSARHLANWGAVVHLLLSRSREAFSGVPGHQLRILERMGVPVRHRDEIPDVQSINLVVDGLIGYSLAGAPRGAAADLIGWANDGRAPILALDVPSGLDSTSGEARPPTIQATATMTLALPKTGLKASGAASFVGELYLADISVPPALYAELDLIDEVGLARLRHLFTEQAILRLR